MDAAAFVDSPASRRGIRRRGGRDTVKINYSKQSIKIIGALGKDTLDLQFHENLATENVIKLLDEIREKYGKVFVIMDNVSAHKSMKMNEYVEGTGGSVVRWFLPPHTPQQNPIEIQWREFKRAVADTFFGGFDKLEERIIAMVDAKEAAITKLFGYMLDAMESQKDSEEACTVQRPHPA